MHRRRQHLPISGRRARARAGLRLAGRRSGLTLVEMMVAVMIISIGLLGLASTAGYVVRQVGGAANQTVATQVVQARLEWMRSVPCSKIVDSSATTRGVYEHWRPISKTNAVLLAIDTVKYSVAGTQKTQVVALSVPCA